MPENQVFGRSGGVHGWPRFDGFKWPPELYYQSYGIIVSIVLWRIFNLQVSAECKLAEWVCKKYSGLLFISKNSLWIYLWHLLGLSLFRDILEKIPQVNYWYVLYVFVLIFSIVVTFCQGKLLNLVKSLK